MKFWLDRKIDGFVFSNIEYLVDPQMVEVVVAPVGGGRRRRQVNTTSESSAKFKSAETWAIVSDTHQGMVFSLV